MQLFQELHIYHIINGRSIPQNCFLILDSMAQMIKTQIILRFRNYPAVDRITEIQTFKKYENLGIGSIKRML